MRKKIFKKTLVMIIIFTMIFSNFGSMISIAETTNFVNIHITGYTGITKVEIYYTPTSEWLELNQQVKDKFYKLEDTKIFINVNITKIRITQGTTETVFSPASDYAGVEAEGTINYWISDYDPIIIHKDVPNVESDQTEFSFEIFMKEKENDPYTKLEDADFTLKDDGTYEFYGYEDKQYYRFVETANDLYNTAEYVYETGKIDKNELYVFTFINTHKVYSISGTKYDTEETPIEGVTIFIDMDESGTLNEGDIETTTDSNGDYTFEGLLPGDYDVYEVVPDGWVQVTPEDFYSVTIDSADVTDKDFVNDELYTIDGYVFNDMDSNNDKDVSETGYENITVYLDSSRTSTTNSDGYYSFTAVPSGDYEVTVDSTSITDPEVTEFDSTLDESVMVTVGPDALNINFGYYTESPLIGGLNIFKNVPNVRGDQTEFTFEIYQLGENGRILIKTLTASELESAYTRLPAGTYYVYEVPMSGYTTELATQVVEVVSGQIADVTFINTYKQVTETYSISGLKFEDIDGNGLRGEEPVLEGFKIYIDENQNGQWDDGESYDITGSDGTYAFSGLENGTYWIAEESKDGWEQTYPTDPSYHIVVIDGENETGLLFGNQEVPVPEYPTITKTVNGKKYVSIETGTTVTFRVVVDNITDDLFVFTFEDDEHPEQNTESGSYIAVEPGEYWDTTYTYRFNSVGTYVNTATAYDAESTFEMSDTATVSVRDNPPPPPPSTYTVSGYVFTDNNGDNSVNGDDKGYSGIKVDLYQGTLKVRTTTTDSNGKYSFTSLRGTYTVVADSGDDISDSQVSEVDGTLDQEVELSVYANKTNVNFGYIGAPLSSPIAVSGYVFNDINKDNLVDNGEMGYDGITVELRNAATDAVITSTLTNANGLYVLSAFVEPGEYLVVNDPFDDIEALYDVIGQVSEYDNLLDETITIESVDGEDNVFLGRNFGYEETPKAITTLLSGYVFNDLNADNVVDTGEIGYSNVEVTLWSNGMPLLTKTTNSDGMYVFDFLTDPELNGLEAGEYTVMIGDTPVNVHAVSEYDGSPFNGIVVLTLADDTEAITNINFGFNDTVVPSGEEANVAMILIGLFMITGGIVLRRKSFVQ
ncbi:MAG: hypothetical protein JW702_01385 [Clostridiales bacterium]|nr:hypothetical protein [Clostridiales bacterium]